MNSHDIVHGAGGMKVLILAAGYGTRLTRDLEASGQLPHLVGMAKPLLPVAGKPLISHWMDILQSRAEIQEVYVVVSDASTCLSSSFQSPPRDSFFLARGEPGNEAIHNKFFDV